MSPSADDPSTKYSALLQKDFVPVLRFFGLKPTGKLLNDLAQLSVAIDRSKTDDQIPLFFFRLYDMDNNGLIGKQELSYMLKDIGDAIGDDSVKNMTDEDIGKAVKMIDSNGKGDIDWEDFRDWFANIMGTQSTK